jgi:hypothetical protein
MVGEHALAFGIDGAHPPYRGQEETQAKGDMSCPPSGPRAPGEFTKLELVYWSDVIFAQYPMSFSSIVIADTILHGREALRRCIRRITSAR